MFEGFEKGINATRLTRTLCALGRVTNLRDLGSQGPLLASAGPDSRFRCLFGRDAIRMAMDLLHGFPAVGRATLLTLATLQGVRWNERSEEEPGRMLHEHRQPDDPEAIRLGKHWDFPYYGAVDTTPQWINLLLAYTAAYGTDILEEAFVDRATRHVTLRDSLSAALKWITRRLDNRCGAGYLWVRRALPTGNRNQVWEDSSDAFHQADGTLLDPDQPFAPVAVQGYVYDALLGVAELQAEIGEQTQFSSSDLRQRAHNLRTLVIERFWQDDLGTFAHAATIDVTGSLTPTRVVASAPGHLLASRLLDGPELASIRKRLITRLNQPDLVAGAGIRTKSTADPFFRPGSYHNGSVWPMDTGVIADGLRRHGADDQAEDLENRILRACVQLDSFPEFFRGELDGSVSINTDQLTYLRDGEVHFREQRPETAQGWTATRIWRILDRRHVPCLTSVP
jgi:glycogen debranching enzyme